jgi:type II secretory pathway component PulJ
MSSPTLPSRERGRGDAGVTLPEVVIGMTILGAIMVMITSSLTVILRLQEPTRQRIAESADIAFVQSWVPVDFASAVSSDATPTLQPFSGRTLAGTNVVTIVREDLVSGQPVQYTVAYRYERAGTEWVLARYEVRGGSLLRIVIAHELSAPPAGWTASQSPSHAVALEPRNQRIVQTVGSDLQVTFASGQQFSTGGSALALRGDQLPTDYSGGIADPAAPRSRCGGTIALVLDTSGSIPNQRGGRAMEDAAVGFIDAFTGTPSRLTVVGFDYRAYQMYPSGVYGQYVSLLNTSSQVTAAKNRILQLDDVDGNFYTTDPNRDGVHWNQMGAATNWEDGMYVPFRDNSGQLLATVPDLVVFITDGDPNVNRTSTSENGSIDAADVNRAVDAANYARGTGARVIGVLVGATSTSSSSIGRMKQVVGSNTWTGTGPTNPGNAATADLFIPSGGTFAQLGTVLRSISAAECGGTVTIQKQIDDGTGKLSDSAQPWTYTTETGVAELDPSRASSITFDFQFPSGTTSKTIELVETPADGFVLDRVVCQSGGTAFPTARQQAASNGAAGVRLTVQPDEAVSCVFISKRR